MGYPTADVKMPKADWFVFYGQDRRVSALVGSQIPFAFRHPQCGLLAITHYS